MTIRRILGATLAASGMLVAAALPAAASHTHVRLLGNGQCVVLAPGGGESQVQLPFADEFAPDRQHPLHVLVHLGEPGMRQGAHVVWVQGSPEDLANCDGYVNR